MMTALLLMKRTIEALCRQDSNLFTADIAINFMLKKLHDANSAISDKYMHLSNFEWKNAAQI